LQAAYPPALDDATWRRARGWAVWRALGSLLIAAAVTPAGREAQLGSASARLPTTSHRISRVARSHRRPGPPAEPVPPHGLRGRGVELESVGVGVGELGPEMGSDEVLDALLEDADDEVVPSRARCGSPELPVGPDVLEDGEQRLQERCLAPGLAFRGVSLGGQRGVDFLETAAQEVLLVAVVG
jgi:hypothetical protein